MKKIKILQVLPSLSQSNGISSYISNYFLNMPTQNIEMTFLVLNKRKTDRYEEIMQNGGKIVELYKEKNVILYLKKMDDFFKENHFDIVHCHVLNFGAFIMYFAKKYNVKTRILHSHVNKSSDKFLHKLRNIFFIPFAILNSNYYFACSDIAGKYVFKNKKFEIIPNAIDVEKYTFNLENRLKIREKLGIENKFVIGEFGRICPQKNQLFMLDIFSNILKYNTNSALLLAGSGSQLELVEKKIEKLGIKDKVLLLGDRKDLDEIYNALDVFVLPSIYEGLGIVLIEAQCNGVKSFTSADVVPKLAKVTDLLEFISLKESPQLWAKQILKYDKYEDVSDRINYSFCVGKSEFNIKTGARYLYDMYMKLYLESEK